MEVIYLWINVLLYIKKKLHLVLNSSESSHNKESLSSGVTYNLMLPFVQVAPQSYAL